MEYAMKRLTMETKHIAFHDKNKVEDGYTYVWCPTKKSIVEIDGKLDTTGLTNICSFCGEELKT